jgi:hypothetical protein
VPVEIRLLTMSDKSKMHFGFLAERRGRFM